MKIKELMKWTILILFFIVCIPSVCAISISSVTVNPSGSLTSGIPVKVQSNIDISGVFPSNSQIQLFTELDNPKWTYTIIVNGVENQRPAMGRTLAISGFELSYKAFDKVSVRVTLEGVAPSVTQTSNKTIIRITEYDANNRPITSSQIDKAALILNTREVTQTLTPTPNYDAKIAALESQLAEQNKKIEQQGNILDQIMNFLRNVLGGK
jgi:hypothetical protein